MDNIERHLASGAVDQAEVLIRFALLTAEGNNLLELTDDEVTIGRREENTIMLEDTTVSGAHCRGGQHDSLEARTTHFI